MAVAPLLLLLAAPDPAALDRCLLDAAEAAPERSRRGLLEQTADLLEARGSTLARAARARWAATPTHQRPKNADRPEYWIDRARQAEARADSYRSSGLPPAEHDAEAALLWLEVDDRAAAAKAAERAQSALRDGDEVRALTRLARYHAKVGAKKQARALLLRARAEADAASEGIRITRYRDVAEGWLELGDTARAEKMLQAATALARAAKSPRDQRDAASDLLHFGRMLVRNGRPDDALRLLPAMLPERRDVAVQHFVEVAGYRDDCALMLRLARHSETPDGRALLFTKIARGECRAQAKEILAEADRDAEGAELRTVARGQLAEELARAGLFDRSQRWLQSMKPGLRRTEAEARVAEALANADRCEAALALGRRAGAAAKRIRTSGNRQMVALDAARALYLCGDEAAARPLEAHLGPRPSLEGARAIGRARRGDDEGALAVLRGLEDPTARLSIALRVLQALGPKVRAADTRFLCPPQK